MMMVTILCASIFSCGDDDDNDNPNNGQPVKPDSNIVDPEGTITISMRNENSGKTYLENSIYIDNADNFMSDWGSMVEFVSLGKVNGLGNIASIPLLGWANKMACIPGNGYVAYIISDNKYYRLYVVDYTVNSSNEVIGAEIKYQSPFKGIDEVLKPEKTSVEFKESGQQIIKIQNSTIIPFKAESSAGWCRVTVHLNELTISAQEAPSLQSEEAIIKLTTLYGKETEIKVIRSKEAHVTVSSDNVSISPNADNKLKIASISSNVKNSELDVVSNSSWLTPYMIDNDNNIYESTPKTPFLKPPNG